jgi:hypothetical protein
MPFNVRHNILLKLTNVAVFLVFFGSRVYTQLEGGASGAKQTYLSPAPFGLSTWALIDFLLLGYNVFQFWDESSDIVNGVGYRFSTVAILNTVFLNLYATQHYIAAFVFALLVYSSVSTVYYTLKNNFYVTSRTDAVLVHLPFSLWHAFSLIIVFLSGFTAFTEGVHVTGPGTFVKIAVVISEGFLTSTAVGYAFYNRQGDVAGAAVITLFLYALFVQQDDNLIRYFALGGAIVSNLAVLKSLYFTFISRDGVISLNSETTPFISA